MAFFGFEMDFFSFETNSDQQVGPPFIGPNQKYHLTISNSGQSENHGQGWLVVGYGEEVPYCLRQG